MNLTDLWRSVFNPALLFAAALALGTAWLARPVPRSIGQIVAPSITTPAPPVITAPIIAPPVILSDPRPQPDLRSLTAELREAQSVISERQNGLHMSKADIEAMQAEIDRLRVELKALEGRHAALASSSPADQTAAIHDLETDVTERREEVSRLQKKIEQATVAVPNNNGPTPHLVRAVEPVNKLPMLVELFQNHITPVTKEYFHFPTFSFKSVFVVTRSRMGETIAEAGQPGSKFVRFLSKIKPKEAYVSCLLNPDSFEAFYAARDMAKKSGVEIGWDPADTSNGAIKIAGVELGSESDKKKIAVPDVVH